MVLSSLGFCKDIPETLRVSKSLASNGNHHDDDHFVNYKTHALDVIYILYFPKNSFYLTVSLDTEHEGVKKIRKKIVLASDCGL